LPLCPFFHGLSPRYRGLRFQALLAMSTAAIAMVLGPTALPTALWSRWIAASPSVSRQRAPAWTWSAWPTHPWPGGGAPCCVSLSACRPDCLTDPSSKASSRDSAGCASRPFWPFFVRCGACPINTAVALLIFSEPGRTTAFRRAQNPSKGGFLLVKCLYSTVWNVGNHFKWPPAPIFHE